MSTYGITATNLADSHAAAMARNLYSGGTELLDQQFPSISNYYYDIAIEYAGGGLLTMTRVWIAAMPTEAAQIHISNDGTAVPSGAIGNIFDLVPTQYATQAPYTSIGIKRATASQVIEDGQVVWRIGGYQTETYSTSGQTGFYDNSRDNAELTIVQTTIPVTFDNDTPWIFQTYHDTPLLNYSPPQSFLDGLDKPSNYYLSFYLTNNNGTASGAERIYFKEDPGTIHIRTYYSSGSFYNGWYLSWELPDDNNGAWNFNLNNQNGASPDWVFTGGSGGWYHKMWEYDSSNPANHGYNIQSPYWLFIFESSVPIEFNGVEIEPTVPPSANGIEYIFNKSYGDDANYFLVNFGCFVQNSNANFYPTARNTDYPNLPGVWNGKRIVPFYGSPRYSPVLRWTSLRTQTDYELEIRDIVALNENYLYNALDQSGFDYYYNGVERVYNWDKGNVNAAIRCMRWLPGQKEIDEWDAIGPVEAAQDFDNWKDFRIVQQFSLGEVVSYMKTLDPQFEDDDIYSELFLDFVNIETGNVNATLSLDYSALFGNGIDPSGGGGGTGDNTNNQWDNDSTDPRLNPDEVINIPMVKPNLGPVGIFNKTYAINSNDLQQLADIISSTDDDVFDAVLDGLKMFGANPINALVDLRLYPYDVANQLNISATKEIILGRYETGIMGVNLAGGSSVSILDLGEIYIPEHYKSFLDYEPYTVLNLYIPYIGTVELPPSQFMNKTAGVRMVVDYTTGAALAVVYSNGIPIIFQNGVIGTSIAMTGDSAAAYANGIISNFLGAASSAAQAIGSAIAKPTPGTIANAVTTGITSVANALDSINETHFQQAGSASPCCNNCTPQKCYLTIARPVLAFQNDYDIILYGEHIGYATQYTTVIQNLPGTGIYYGVLSEHDQVSVNEPTPTAKEIDMIKQALNNGFFISQSHLSPNSN